MVWEDFEKSFQDLKDVELHVCMGDLFDRPYVSYNTILEAANIYAVSAFIHQKTTFVVIRGNHDVLRDMEKHSAFDVFANLVKPWSNIVVVDDDPVRIGNYGFFPWHPTRTEQLTFLSDR